MSIVTKNLIEYSGTDDEIPRIESPSSFKELVIRERVSIAKENPDIKEIIKVMTQINISHTKIIRTPIVQSYEGNILTGKQLIVEGELNQKLEYMADVPSHQVHGVFLKIPFSTYIVLPMDTDVASTINAIGYIEYINVLHIEKRSLLESAIIFIVARC